MLYPRRGLRRCSIARDTGTVTLLQVQLRSIRSFADGHPLTSAIGAPAALPSSLCVLSARLPPNTDGTRRDATLVGKVHSVRYKYHLPVIVASRPYSSPAVVPRN